jgi:hypothetical protein
MRRGELCGIFWDDVDLKNGDRGGGRIVVRWQITDQSYRRAIAARKRGERGRFRTKPKTRSARIEWSIWMPSRSRC